MRISIAGAGAGKTTKIADSIISCYEKTATPLNIYCIAFTNNAADCIGSKLTKHFGSIPTRIKVSTIHSFLYQEIIRPYYYLLYGRHYDRILNIKLPTVIKFKNRKISDLDDLGILHVTVIPERAKWVLVKKTGDSKREKYIRNVILSTLTKYWGSIYIDEAQDIDGDFLEILKTLKSNGFHIELMGDPKQDLKGFGNLRKLVELYPENVHYITECHRCPQMHLKLSNTLVCDAENQNSQKTQGALKVIFESDISTRNFINESSFDLIYISAKNTRFETHDQENTSTRFETLNHELRIVLAKIYSGRSNTVIARAAYYYAIILIRSYQITHDAQKTMKAIFTSIRLSTSDYARIIQALQINDDNNNEKISVHSIDSIKGQEGYNCLFILTTDLAAYLFAKKTSDNKTKNKLYVALTRSLNNLTILITKEVEDEYGHDFILTYTNCC